MPETSYQRANRLADEASARRWRALYAHDPLPRSAFIDFDTRLAPVLVPYPAHGDRRSSREARLYDHQYLRLRPTEDEAFIAARGEDWRDKLVFLRQEPARAERYCYGCKSRHLASDFSRDKRAPSGLAYFCDSWRRRQRARQVIRAA